MMMMMWSQSKAHAHESETEVVVSGEMYDSVFTIILNQFLLGLILKQSLS